MIHLPARAKTQRIKYLSLKQMELRLDCTQCKMFWKPSLFYQVETNFANVLKYNTL